MVCTPAAGQAGGSMGHVIGGDHQGRRRGSRPVSAATRPRSSLWSQRFLIWNFARRDLKSRFKGTALGWLWSLMLPLATLATYSLVFSVVFRSVPPDFGSGETGNFTVWLMTGLVPWTFFLIAINVAIPTLLATGPLLQKIYFPAYASILGSVLAVLVQTLIEFAVVAVVLLLFHNIGPTWLLFPAWLVLFVTFATAVATTLAVANIQFRDVAHLTSVALQLLFFLTPIIYPITSVPETLHGIPLRALVMLSPLAAFVDAMRALAYGLVAPSASDWALMLGWTAIALAVARLVYQLRGQDIAEFA
jgi:ABC-type polysaccharide/polyol phosphate export permease